MAIVRVVRLLFAVVVLSLTVAQTDLSAVHAQLSTLCTVGQCFDVSTGLCTGQDCGHGLPHCAPHQICDQRGRYCPCSPEPAPTPPPTPLPTPTATPTPCIDTVLCIIGFHWSSTACQCVPDNPSPTPCVDTVLCIRGFHWSPERCACVPDHPHSPHAPGGPHPVHVPHVPHSPRRSAEPGCVDSGGTVTSGVCCRGVGDFPNTCLIGACGCAPDASHEVRVCDCGDARCFDGVTCTGSR